MNDSTIIYEPNEVDLYRRLDFWWAHRCSIDNKHPVIYCNKQFFNDPVFINMTERRDQEHCYFRCFHVYLIHDFDKKNKPWAFISF